AQPGSEPEPISASYRLWFATTAPSLAAAPGPHPEGLTASNPGGQRPGARAPTPLRRTGGGETCVLPLITAARLTGKSDETPRARVQPVYATPRTSGPSRRRSPAAGGDAARHPHPR